MAPGMVSLAGMVAGMAPSAGMVAGMVPGMVLADIFLASYGSSWALQFLSFWGTGGP